MDTSRNDLLGEIAADAELERTDFLASASSQLSRFLDANESRIREMGGLVLIDDEADYLAIAEDMSFRSRNPYLDEATGKWKSEIEVIESVAELAEMYNPADIFAAFGEATRLEAGAETAAAGGGVSETIASRTGALYAEAADDWAAGRPDEEPPETEDQAAERLYDLALAFQEKSQQVEAQLFERFESAATDLAGVLGEFIIIDDDDERMTLKPSGCFAAEVLPDEEEGRPSGEWRKLDGPDALVEFYDPTDVFGDLADALAEAFPEIAGEMGDLGEPAESAEAEEPAGSAEAEEPAESAEAEEPAESAEAEEPAESAEPAETGEAEGQATDTEGDPDGR